MTCAHYCARFEEKKAVRIRLALSSPGILRLSRLGLWVLEAEAKQRSFPPSTVQIQRWCAVSQREVFWQRCSMILVSLCAIIKDVQIIDCLLKGFTHRT